MSKRKLNNTRYEEGTNIENKPRFAEIKYDEIDGEIIYANYTKLEKYIDEVYLECNMRRKGSKKYVQLNTLKKLHLNEDEFYYTINYLNKKNIYVYGNDTLLNIKEFENYVYYPNDQGNLIKHGIDFKDKKFTNNKELFLLYEKTKDSNVREEIILSNISLVATTIIQNGFDINDADIFQNGIIGLIKAVDNYDVNKGFAFSTYAFYIIKYEIIHYFINSNEKTKDNLLKRVVKKTIYLLEKDNELEQSFVEIDKIVAKAMENKNMNRKDYLKYTRNYVNLLYCQLVPDMDSEEYANIYSEEDFSNNIINKILIEELLATLNERTREIIKLRYGFYGNKEYTCRELENRFGISFQRINQIENETLKILRHRLEKEPQINVLKRRRDNNE